MISLWQIFLLFLGLELLCINILALHRFSPLIGLNPLLLVLGTLVVFLHIHMLGVYTFNAGSGDVTFSIEHFIVLPILLFGLLIIYVINGASQARSALIGMIAASLLIALISAIYQLRPAAGDNSVESLLLQNAPPLTILASAGFLLLDMAILAIVYQTVSKFRSRSPSRVAGAAALMLALWSNTLFMTGFVYLETHAGLEQLPAHLLGSTLSGLALCPALIFYIHRTAAIIPNYQAEFNERQLAEALAQATGVLNTTLDIEEVLDHILEQTIRVVPCRSVNLMLIEDEQTRVVRQLHRSSNNEIYRSSNGPVMPLETPTLHHILQTGTPLVIPDTVQNDMWREMAATTWIRSYAAAPLRLRDKVIGFLNVNSEKANFFTEETTRHLQAFASNAAAAIHNARLYQDLHRQNLELEERVRARTLELRTAKERTEVILASVPDAVFVLDQTGQMLEANQAGQALHNQAQQAQIDLFNPDFLSHIKDGAAPNEKAVLEVQQRAYQALASSLPIQTERSGWVIVFRDVTRFRELDEMKTRFVSDVSHELRTPLTSLSLYLELLSQENDEERRKRFIGILVRETKRLAHLIEDLLTISRLEANRVALQIEPVDVAGLAQELAMDRIPMAHQHGLQLVFSSAPILPLVQVDPRLLTQVLSNLLTNAMNYTQEGGIHVHTDVHQAESGCWVTISVTDTGVGVKPEELHLVFDRFYRGTASKRTGAGGTGLGLAISREIVNQLGGRLTVQSTPGQGSTFVVWLPAML